MMSPPANRRISRSSSASISAGGGVLVGTICRLAVGSAPVGEELDVVHQEHVDVEEALPVRLAVAGRDGGVEGLDELVQGEILDAQLRVDRARGMSDGHQQVGLAEARAGVDEQRVVHRPRRFGDSLRRGDREPIGCAHDERVEAVVRIERDRHATGLPTARRLSTSSEIPRRVSNTPLPCSASAGKLGTARKLSASSISSCERIRSRGRSCLLYWKTTGSWRMSTPCASRLSCRFWRLSRLSSKRRAWLSPTKTTPSAPWSTS